MPGPLNRRRSIGRDDLRLGKRVAARRPDALASRFADTTVAIRRCTGEMGTISEHGPVFPLLRRRVGLRTSMERLPPARAGTVMFRQALSQASSAQPGERGRSAPRFTAAESPPAHGGAGRFEMGIPLKNTRKKMRAHLLRGLVQVSSSVTAAVLAKVLLAWLGL